MDVKNAFLNRYLKEEVYIEQRLRYEDPKDPNYVFKLHKSLYGFKQSPRAWYERLSPFLIYQGFKSGNLGTTLFTKGEKIN